MGPIPTVKFTNGVEMPMVGLGTWQAREESATTALEVALVEAHYPLIDTAAAYKNEDVIGALLARLFDEGKLKREDIFITTKIAPTHVNPERQLACIEKSLKDLRVDKVDLLLAHVPTALALNFKDQEKDVTVEQIWKGLEQIYEKGLARSIGVSNWSPAQIERAMKIAKVPIHNCQVEAHIYWPQHELHEVCNKHGIKITSYGSLGSPGRTNVVMPDGSRPKWAETANPLEDENVLKLAKKYGKTPGQILLRYLVDRGISVIPKSVTPERIRQNIDIVDFKLTEAGVDEVKSLESPEKRARFFTAEFMIGHPEDAYKAERK